MVSSPRPVNGLAWEILFFLKNSNAKRFEGGNLGSELTESRKRGGRSFQRSASSFRADARHAALSNRKSEIENRK